MIPYSAVFGGYDKPQRAPAGGVLFTDSMPPESFGWGARVVTPPFPDNLARSNRYFKLQPHQHFPDGARVLYFDASMTLNLAPAEILARFQEIAGRDHDVFTLRHSLGHTLGDEPAWVQRKRITRPDVLQLQRERYERLGAPADLPTAEPRLIITRINDRTRAFYDAWWSEVKAYSHRDQISFPYARWVTNPSLFLVPYALARPMFAIKAHARPQLREAT